MSKPNTLRTLGRRKLRNEPLTTEDWREIYDFLRFVQQPFFERIVERARRRAAMTEAEAGDDE